MMKLIKNIRNADADTKLIIYPFGAMAIISAISAIATPWLLFVTAICLLMCLAAYVERNN